MASAPAGPASNSSGPERISRSGWTRLSLIVLLAISGCERVWFVEILEVLPNLTPVFCVSEKEHCRGDAVGLAVFGIQEVISMETDEGPRDQYKTVWLVQATRSAPLSRVTYGVAPDGWEESVPAVPLRLGAIYEIDSMRFSLYREASGAIGWKIEPWKPATRSSD